MPSFIEIELKVEERRGRRGPALPPVAESLNPIVGLVRGDIGIVADHEVGSSRASEPMTMLIYGLCW